jgi:Domain of unknown function (DUF1841)
VTDEERRTFVVPQVDGEYDGLDLALLDRSDPDERRFLIEAEHPELHAALRSGRREIQLAGETMSPGLHIAMHEIVANQLWDGDPPEAWETAKRLLDAGYERHEVLHMLGSVVAGELFEVMNAREPADLGRMRAAFAALPGSWEQQRTERAEQPRANRAERRAAHRRRRH